MIIKIVANLLKTRNRQKKNNELAGINISKDDEVQEETSVLNKMDKEERLLDYENQSTQLNPVFLLNQN